MFVNEEFYQDLDEYLEQRLNQQLLGEWFGITALSRIYFSQNTERSRNSRIYTDLQPW